MCNVEWAELLEGSPCESAQSLFYCGALAVDMAEEKKKVSSCVHLQHIRNCTLPVY